ncbi:MAG: AMP-binding protein [Acidimicrobiia bacterium]
MTLTTIDQMVRAHLGSSHPAILFDDERHTWDEHARASAARAQLALDLRHPGPFHIGFLFENIPELSFWLGAGAVSGAAMVGINPTRQGAELAHDIRHTDCQLIVTESRLVHLLDGLDTGVPPDRVLVVDSPEYRALLAPYEGAPFPDVDIPPEQPLVFMFTSGTTGAPKAAIIGHGRLAAFSNRARAGLDSSSVCYSAMPMFHSNALFTTWGPAVCVGATMALRRRFSASAFLDDVRRYGATNFNYVGKPLTYILATPERPDDADNTLVRVGGNEAAERDIQRFSERFGVPVVDGYGSTEGGVTIMREPGQPKGALGRAPEGVEILDPETGAPCPVAEFDADGRLVNADVAIGEIVNKLGGATFEGYYKNDEANERRSRNGWYWSGDLGYRDRDGWVYFGGRDFEWLRVDGENFAAAPVERILAEYPGVVLAAVYAVPDPEVGDQVMAALHLADPGAFDAARFDAFLAAQPDLGTKWSPRFVRACTGLPMTETAKVLKRPLRAERWECDDPVWWRPTKDAPLERLDAAGIESLRRAFEERGRLGELDKV